MAEPLDAAVDDFVARVHAVLTAVAGRASVSEQDVVMEAANLCGALIDADGRLTDDELWAWIGAFGRRLPTSLARATPNDLRTTDIVRGTKAWAERPSTLFALLVEADRRHRTRHCVTYYEQAMHLAHMTASLDLVPSMEELAAIDRFRVALLHAMDAAGLARPGHPDPSATPSSPSSPTSPVAPPVAPSPPPPLPPERPIAELMAELDELVGLREVKAEVRLVADLLQVQRLRIERKLPVLDTTRHMVFTGNPGTGKTTVARLLSQIYRTLGVVSKGHLVETDRSQMVAGYVGQTAPKTRAVIEQALGGTLLIDEAYALARGNENDFGREAIDTLVKMMEDHRDDLVVIAAGYLDEMADFMDANTGLRSRFPKTIEFPDYTDDELIAIFSSMGAKARYEPDETARAELRSILAATPRAKGFGNARLIRNLFEASVARHASRVVKLTDPTEQQLTTLTADDLRESQR